ncbi:MAG: transglutaminase-like cysteine peptidase, partial [Gammaproteobacteria bacterium]|nr:transglutaminase-like cysteine peptidase [Gammaproteobacteria bacterium]
ELILEKDKLTRVNNFFNEIPYRDDFENWDNKDYWATPIEMIGVNAADCEDYAIAKYFSLRDMGVSSEKLRITYVKAIEINQAHMVLAYYQKPDAIPLILDNLKPDIRSADKRNDLVPVYSFNAEGLWLAVNRGSGKRLGNASKVKLWSDLREKMKKELSQ